MEKPQKDNHEAFHKEFQTRILLPFSRELEVHKDLYAYPLPLIAFDPEKRAEKLSRIRNWLQEHPSVISASTETLKEHNTEVMKHLLTCLVLARMAAPGPDHWSELRPLFIALLALKVQYLLTLLNEISEIQSYRAFTARLADFYAASESLPPGGEEEQIQVIRCHYSILHQAFFEPEKQGFSRCLEWLRQDRELSAASSPENRITALSNYLELSLDHLYFKPACIKEYINIEEFNQIQAELCQMLGALRENGALEKLSGDTCHRFFVPFFRIRTLNILLKMQKKQGISAQYKKEMLILITELINLFYGETAEVDLFFYNTQLEPAGVAAGANPFAPFLAGDIYKNLSGRLSRLLGDQNHDVTGLLYVLSHFFRLFKEFQKINLSSYKRILILARNCHNRRLFLVLTLHYLKTLYKIDVFHSQARKLKAGIEQLPIPTLVHYFNKEINSLDLLAGDLKNALRLDNFVTTIHLKEFEIRRHLLQATEELRAKGQLNAQTMNWLDYLKLEFQNMFILARNMDLIKDLGQLYCFFIDTYIKNERMEYREDFIQKATALKMQILDINPYYFIISLLYSKTGKLRLLYTADPELAYAARKIRLTDGEKAKLAAFIPLSLELLPREEEGVHWAAVEQAILHLRDPAVSSGRVAPPESRVLKVLSAILNKITRQDITSDKLFYTLYEEAFVPTKNEWDLDPVIILYLNKFLKNQGRLRLYSESRGDLIEMQLNVFMNNQINEKIGRFIKQLIENTPTTDQDIASQMEELSRLNEIPLVEEGGKRVRISLGQIKEYVKAEKAVFYESSYLEQNEIRFLTKLMETYFLTIAKQSYSTGFKFILGELIRNANEANLKTAHFKYIKQDMNLRYELGMRSFHAKKMTQRAEYQKIIRAEGLKVKVVFHVFKNNLLISVSNNFKFHAREIDLIHEKIATAGTTLNTREAVLESAESGETAGSNITVMLLLLRKYGLFPQYFKLNLKAEETVFRVSLPLSLVTDEQREVIATELTREIEGVPMLRSHIQELRRIIYNPESTIDQIEKLLGTDPNLVMDVLKLANSAHIMAGQPIETIREAIKLLGLKELHNMVLVSHSYRLLTNKVSERRMEKIIKHCQLTAFYAREIIRRKRIKQVDVENVYLASLLHDIGVIIIEGLEPDIYMQIQAVLQSQAIPLEVIENLAGGINHALVGYKLAEKWNFSPFLQEAIRYHHTPAEAPNHMNEVFIICLANTLTHYNAGELLYENIDPNVLIYFDLNSREEVDELGRQLEKAAQERREVK